VIRVAAVGDVHYDRSSRERLRSHFLALAGRADLLLVAGDLTRSGSREEAEAIVADLSELPVPVVTVLGNHDYHQGQEELIRNLLRARGIHVLEGSSASFVIGGVSVGVAGLKGFGGGFFGACVTEFGEDETKAFARHARLQAETLRRELLRLKTEFRFALLHFSPIEGTLFGERKEIYPFLGSYLLAEAIDEAGADAAFHGHAHFGTERGMTPGGVPVRNVAQTVIRHACNIYSFDRGTRVAREAHDAAVARGAEA
jgi:Icc-related predicted phosphoesterase